MSFTLRYPVQFVRPQSIGAVDKHVVGALNLSLEHDAGYHVFTVWHFESSEAAVQFSERLWLALMWAATIRHTAFIVNGIPRIETLLDDPEEAGRRLMLNRPIDVLIDKAFPAVFPSSARLGFVSAGTVGVSNHLPFERFAPTLQEALDVAGSVRLTDRLSTALVLFNGHYYEASSASKLVTLMMCLEVLAEGQPKHPEALALLDRWEAELQTTLVETADPDLASSLESLARELFFRREDSLRSRVRRLAFDSVRSREPDEREAFAKDVVRLYDLRSTLIHEGTVPAPKLGQASSEAREVVGEILRAQLLRSGATA